MRVYILAGSNSTHIGTACFSVMPHEGETVYLRVSAGAFTKDGQTKPIDTARLKVERVEWEAFNNQAIEEWQHPWNYEKDAVATMYVSALDEGTRAYIERLEREEEDQGGQS